MKRTGKEVPDLAEMTNGPFIVVESDNGPGAEDKVEINEHYLELLFVLMPGIAGNHIWKGTQRCGRNPNYSMNKVRVGKMKEMVTPSDEAFVIWTCENFYDSVVHEVDQILKQEEDATHKIERRLQGKYTKQGTKKYSGWTPEGKLRWNELVKECGNQWISLERDHHLRTQYEKAKHDFIDMFERDWIRKVHRPATANHMREEKSEDAAGNCFVTSFEV